MACFSLTTGLIYSYVLMILGKGSRGSQEELQSLSVFKSEAAVLMTLTSSSDCVPPTPQSPLLS